MIKIYKVFFLLSLEAQTIFLTWHMRCQSYFLGDITVDHWNTFWFYRKEVATASTNTKVLLANAAVELYLE